MPPRTVPGQHDSAQLVHIFTITREAAPADPLPDAGGLAINLPGISAAAASAGIEPSTAAFASATPSVLVIDSLGLAMPVAAGTADVTITSGDGRRTARQSVEIRRRTGATAVPKSIRLRTSATVAQGKTLLMIPYLDDNHIAPGTIAWSSSNPAVASVDQNGVVTGAATGRAVIRAEVNGTRLSASCTVTVVTPGGGVTSVTLNRSAVSLAVGKTSTLNVNYLPTNAAGRGVTWVSSDESVARVTPTGMITAIDAGKAFVTAVCDLTGVTARCDVTVTIPVVSVAVSPKTLTMDAGTEALLSHSINPSNASERSVTWISSNTRVATVDANGRVRAVGAGTATITVRTIDGNRADTSRVTVR
jgi:uncharacterized protein YjdB